MIDFHTHILPQIDDGSRSIEESIHLIQEAKEAGFNDIILTSHFCEDLYEAKIEDRRKILESIKKVLENLNIDINLYLGSEIFISNDIVDMISDGRASTINNSRYVLFELPLGSKVQNLKTIIYKLIENNNIPIIAHPERYHFVQEDPSVLDELVEMGVLFQANYGSIIGIYGNHAKKTVKKLFKNNIISFLGSDVHRENSIYPQIDKMKKKIAKIIGEEKLEEISEINPRKVLEGQQIEK